MKHFTKTIFFLAIAATCLQSQDMIRQQGLISITPTYQSWSFDNNGDFSEVSAPLFLYYPVNRNLSLSLRGNPGSADGDNLETLSGVGDAQLSAAYYLEQANTVFNVGFNAPTGKTELSSDEFNTSTVISQDIFDLQIPNFGQGMNLSAGFTWAAPLSESFVVGLGASYQLRGEYKPISGLDYNPGDELLITGGFDFGLGALTTWSADVLFITYGTDKIGEEDVFAAGNKFVVNTQIRKQFGFNEIRLRGQYRSRAKNERAVILGQALSEEPEKTFPTQFEFQGMYRPRLSPQFYLGILAEVRVHEKTPAVFSGITLVGGGLAPEIVVSPQLRIPARIQFFTGSMEDGPDLTGIEGSLGLQISF